jgi:aspartate kinase
MKVFKFGGASVKDVEGIKNVGKIVKQHQEEPLLIVVSAMGKTTNALENVVKAFYEKRNEDALNLFEQIKQQHLNIAKYLLVKEAVTTEAQLLDFFTEVEWLLHDNAVRDYDYYYDQIVCIGELLSTTLVSAYLKEININNTWLDIRDYFRTDNNFRDANIDIEYTQEKVNLFKKYYTNTCNIVLTQGFIGCTQENESTTLGREGSDYSAALIANMSNAQSVTIWKDVKGVLNADPKQFEDTTLLPHLSYTEVIEMAYYGAQVIHPKTIKPLQNKNIPLYVKCFLDASLAGTLIDGHHVKNLPPIIVNKTNQVWLQLESKDFSFVGEKPMAMLYEMLGNLKIKPNLVQTGAISVSICIDDNAEKLEQLALKAAEIFDVTMQKGLTLLTIRHHDRETQEKLVTNKTLLMQQKTADTYQALMG